MKNIIALVILLIGGQAFGQRDSDDIFAIMSSSSTANKYDTSVVYISTFSSFKPDFERLCGITTTYNGTTGKWQATNTQRPFNAEDSGKIIVIKEARSYVAYRKLPFTLNAIIEKIEGNIAIIKSYDANNAGTIIAVTGKCGWVATDNFEIMQAAIDSCAVRGKKTLMMNYRGTAYIVPSRSSRPRIEAYRPGLMVRNDLTIRGYDSGKTFIKAGSEDISRVSEVDNPFYTALIINNCSFTLKKITLLSADRTSTNRDHQNVTAVYGNPATRLGQRIYIDSSSIYSEDYNGFTGWGIGVYMNSSQPLFATDTAIMSITHSSIIAQAPAAFYSKEAKSGSTTYGVDTLNRLLRIHYSVLRGGAKYTHKYSNADIKPGCDTLYIHDTNFSFYDFTDYEGFRSNVRAPIVCIPRYGYTGQALGPDGVYWCRISKVINDSTALFDTAYNADYYEGGMRGSFVYSTSTDTVKGYTINGVNPHFLTDLEVGDRINSITTVMGIGIIKEIVNDSILVLTTPSAISGTSGVIININRVGAKYLGPNYRFRPVPWQVNTGTVYLTRYADFYAAFHASYVTYIVGVDFKYSSFQPLRFSRNAQNVCDNPINECGSCLNPEGNNALDPYIYLQTQGVVGIDDPNWFKDGEEVYHIIYGDSNGADHRVTNGKSFLRAAPQKR